VRGFRADGDVRLAFATTTLFGIPEEQGANYLDNLPGACVLTTGDALAQQAADPRLIPSAAGSTLWQTLAVPAEARSLQLRLAAATQEFPADLDSPRGDFVVVAFDGARRPIASGTLAAFFGVSAGEAATCAARVAEDPGAACGAFVAAARVLGAGETSAFGLSSSTTAAPGGPGCAADARCYAGATPPQLLCYDLPEAQRNVEATLRVTVLSGRDAFLDTAIAIDSVAFSRTPCDDASGRLTADPLLAVRDAAR
jgi:hypothetical protein